MENSICFLQIIFESFPKILQRYVTADRIRKMKSKFDYSNFVSPPTEDNLEEESVSNIESESSSSSSNSTNTTEAPIQRRRKRFEITTTTLVNNFQQNALFCFDFSASSASRSYLCCSS